MDPFTLSRRVLMAIELDGQAEFSGGVHRLSLGDALKTFNDADGSRRSDPRVRTVSVLVSVV